jgi:hypothetical protein
MKRLATWDGLNQSAPVDFTEPNLPTFYFDQLLPMQLNYMGFQQGHVPLPSLPLGVVTPATLHFDPMSPSQLEYMGYPPDPVLPSTSSVDLVPSQAEDGGPHLSLHLAHQVHTYGSISYCMTDSCDTGWF